MAKRLRWRYQSSKSLTFIPILLLFVLLSLSFSAPAFTETFPIPKPLPLSSARKFFDEGVALYERGDYVAANHFFELAQGLEPNNPVFLYNLGMSYYKLGNNPRAIEVLLEAVKIAPGYVKAYDALGFVLEKQGKEKDAYPLYQQALLSAPGDTYALRALERLERRPAEGPQKFWTLDVRTSQSRFELNPSQAPAGSSPRSDFALTPTLDFVFNRLVRPNLRLGMLYSFGLDSYVSQSNLNVLVNFLRGNAQWLATRTISSSLILDYETDSGTQGGFYQNLGYGLSINIAKVLGSTLRLALTFRNETFPLSTTSNAGNLIWDAYLFRPLAETTFLQISLQLRNHDAVDPDSDYDRSAISASLSQYLDNGLSLQGRILYMPRNHRNRDTIAGVIRQDTLLQLVAQVGYELWKGSELRASLQYFNNTSNVALRQWSNLAVSGGIDFQL